MEGTTKKREVILVTLANVCNLQSKSMKSLAAELKISEQALRAYLVGDTKLSEWFMTRVSEILNVPILNLFPESSLIQTIKLQLRVTKT